VLIEGKCSFWVNAKMPASASFFEILDRPAFDNLPDKNYGRTTIYDGVEMI
jgi:hypothetical protein